MKSQAAIKEHLKNRINEIWFPYIKRMVFLTSSQVVNVQLYLDYYVDYQAIKETQDEFKKLYLEVVLTKLTTTETMKNKRTYIRIGSRPVGFTDGMNMKFACYDDRMQYFNDIGLDV